MALPSTSLAEAYAGNPVIRSLIQLVPFGLGSAMDVGIVHRAFELRNKRLRMFYDELASGTAKLTAEIIEQEDFLHCFFAATKGALNARKSEKVILFAKLLKSSFQSDSPKDLDETEELIGVLEDVSYREWKSLLLLSSFFEQNIRKADHNDLQHIISFWPEFKTELTKYIEIPEVECSSFMNRIERTGLYSQFVGSFLDYSGGIGYLTPRFYRLKALIEDGDASR